MKKISLFMLMIFGIFTLFATDAATETAQENAVAPEQAKPAETAQEPVETSPETTQESAETATAPAETAPEQAQPAETAQEPVETSPETPQESAETAQEPSETMQEPVETFPETQKSGKPQKVKYYRPYLGAGVPLIVIGSVSFALMMPAMGTMAFAASDACEGKDWGFCEELHENNKKHHTAWTVGAVMTGVVGAGMIAVGSWLTSIRKPRENQCVTLNGFAVLPTKEGMYASIGLGF